MSRHYRHENDCLNCGAIVKGKFCSECGQENLEPKESFTHLFGHFFSHYFHFDSKFWSSIKPLLTKPGFLTIEYSLGRRASYVNPLNLYFFISVFYFIFSSIVPSKSEQNMYKITSDGGKELNIDSLKLTKEDSYVIFGGDTINANRYASIQEYNKAQKALPKEKRDDYLTSAFTKRDIQLRKDPENMQHDVKEKIQKNTPKIMFIMLPVFALFVHIFYRNKKKYFVENVIFSIHIHSFIFVVLLCTALLNIVIPANLYFFVFLAFVTYLFLASRRVFQQSKTKTAFKTFGIIFGYLICFGILQIMNTLLSFLII